MLEYQITATRIDAHGSLARCKDAEIVLDTDVQRRPDALNPAELLLADPARTEYRDTLVSPAKNGVPVHVCRNIAEDMGKAEEFPQLGFTLEYARNAFVRYALEGAAVVSF